MKAKVKNTDEIINVDRVLNDDDGTFFYSGKEPDNRTWKAHEIELLRDSHDEVTIEGWVARDFDGLIYLHKECPQLHEESGSWFSKQSIRLDNSCFPFITWDCEPKRVKIIITPMNDLESISG